MGAGRTVPQRLKRIDDSIQTGLLHEKEALKDSLERAEREGKAVHLAGIISDGGIHGHIDHLKALLDISDYYDLEQVWIHAFTDGRDVAPKSAEGFLEEVEEKIEELDVDAGIATVMGRYYSMDRDHNWDRTHKAYRAMAEGEGFEFGEPEEAVEKTYDQGDYDYFVIPSVNQEYPGMTSDDQVIFYNFRADRERQIEEELVEQVDPDDYEEPINPNFVSMFRYEHEIETPAIFEKKIVENTLGEKIQENGLSQLRVAESQKRPHVTYFFNGQRELEFEDEDREFVESDKIKAYDQAPEMHADETTDTVIEALEKGEKDFILLNYANGDLVGHTGDLEASITAMETVDRNIGRLKKNVEEEGYAMVLTAENPNTSHTLNHVPLMLHNTEKKAEDGELWEVSQYIQEILDI